MLKQWAEAEGRRVEIIGRAGPGPLLHSGPEIYLLLSAYTALRSLQSHGSMVRAFCSSFKGRSVD